LSNADKGAVGLILALELASLTNRKRSKVEEYKVGNWVLLSTKDLKYQMKGRQSEKLTE